MQGMHNGEPKQERLTFQDTKKQQEFMRAYLSKKIQYPVVTQNDVDTLPDVVADALLSQPALSGVKPTMELRGIRIPLAPNVYSFLLKILNAPSYKKSDGKWYTRWSLREKVYEIELSTLWRLLLVYCDQLSAGSLAEALSRSKEKEIRKGIGVREFLPEENE